MSRARGRVDAQEFASFARRIVRAYARRAHELEPADLTDMLAIRAELDLAITAAVCAVKGQGFSWSEIAEATGVQKQSAHERWGAAVRTHQKAVRAALTAETTGGDAR